MRSHMLILTLTTALGLSSTGCIKKVLVDGQIESTRNAASSADTIGDYDVGRIAAQAGLAQFEGMHALSPDNQDALFLLAKTWTGYGSGFCEDDMQAAQDQGNDDLAEYDRKRARMAYDRAVFTRFAESVLVAFEPPTFVTFDRAGNTPPLAPAHVANLWLSRPLPAGWELGAGGRYVSRQFIAADNAFAIPGAFTADASLSLPLGPFKGRVDLKNLFGERTYTRGLGTTSVIPASGFAIYAGIEARWAVPRLAARQPQ